MDGAILIHEPIHSLQKEKNKGMQLKLDRKKVFDIINWVFVKCMIARFGFDSKWIQWIIYLISGPSFSILINGYVASLFNSS